MTIDQASAVGAEPRNMTVLVLHQVMFRVAWIFKTESVLMPAFLDSITTIGWVRGMLPPLNRLAQSSTPLVFAGRLRDSPLKSRWLPRITSLMGVPFLVLGALLRWSPTEVAPFFPLIFLSLYTLFFAASGLHQTVFSTVQGKLIAPSHRGRLMAMAGYVGSPVAVIAAWFIMQPWVEQSPPAYSSIFLFTGAAFVVAAGVARLLSEQADQRMNAARRMPLRETARWLKVDPHLRRLCLLSSLVAFTMVIFPHYQRIGREMSGYEGRMLMIWVICQNLGAAVFSWIAGRVADSRGTRSALRLLTLASVLAPLIPLVLMAVGNSNLYWLTFVWLGTAPVTFRMLLNYALELTDQPQHPVYVSTAVLCTAPPILLAPAVGEVVARLGYVLPFCGVAGVLALAFALTLRMAEPRHPGFVRARPPELGECEI